MVLRRRNERMRMMKLAEFSFCTVMAFFACATASCSKDVQSPISGSETPAHTNDGEEPRVGDSRRDAKEFVFESEDGAPGKLVIGDPATVSARLGAYRCTDMDSCESNLFGAASEAEAAWLERNDYPSPEEDVRYSAMSAGELEAAAKNGDVLASTYLGQRLIDNGKSMDGLGWLFNASLNGSVHASYAFAEAYATDASIMNISESAAYYKLAFMQGDRKAINALVTQFPQLTAADLVAADRRAMQLYNGLLAAKVRARKTIRIAPRP